MTAIPLRAASVSTSPSGARSLQLTRDGLLLGQFVSFLEEPARRR